MTVDEEGTRTTSATAAAAAASEKKCDIETANPMFPQGIQSPKLHLHRTSSQEGNLLSGRPLQLYFMVPSIVPLPEPRPESGAPYRF